MRLGNVGVFTDTAGTYRERIIVGSSRGTPPPPNPKNLESVVWNAQRDHSILFESFEVTVVFPHQIKVTFTGALEVGQLPSPIPRMETSSATPAICNSQFWRTFLSHV